MYIWGVASNVIIITIIRENFIPLPPALCHITKSLGHFIIFHIDWKICYAVAVYSLPKLDKSLTEEKQKKMFLTQCLSSIGADNNKCSLISLSVCNLPCLFWRFFSVFGQYQTAMFDSSFYKVTQCDKILNYLSTAHL